MTQNPDTPDNEPDDSLQFGPDDESLQAELKAYKKAIEEEFASNNETQLDPVTKTEAYTRKFFRQHLPAAAAQVVWLSSNSDSYSVRLKACSIIIKEALEDARSEGDPIRDILEQLAAQPTGPVD